MLIVQKVNRPMRTLTDIKTNISYIRTGTYTVYRSMEKKRREKTKGEKEIPDGRKKREKKKRGRKKCDFYFGHLFR